MTDPAGKRHSAPCSNRDFDFFYQGLEENRLLVQRCTQCSALRNLPSPGCSDCGSLDWEAQALSGTGQIYSYVTHHHPPLPGFAAPHPIALVEMSEGVRMLGAMDGTPPLEITIGGCVTVEFLRRGEVAAFRFRPA